MLGLLLAACSEDGKVSGGTCVTNQNCPMGEQCVGGTCVTAVPTGCKNDDACPLGQYCNLTTRACEMVVVTGCSQDEMCPAHQRCNTLTGVCIDGRRNCTSEAQCSPIGKHCNTTIQQCVDCLINTDCPTGKICAPDGSCIDENQPGCTTDAMCSPPASVCFNSQCVAGCHLGGSPVSCALGEVCNSNTGHCVPGQTNCTSDTNCSPPSTICESSQCIPGCTQIGGLQCTGGNVCNSSTGRCQPPSGTCTTDQQCGAPVAICEASQCVPGCGQQGGMMCGAGTVCDTGSGRCVMVMGPCSTDAQCSPPMGVCELGQCVPGCTEIGGIQCAGNTVCNATTGRCDPGPMVCTNDAQCAPPATICNTVTGACVAGCQTTGCTAPETCNTTSGRCQQPQVGAALNAVCANNSDCASSVCFDLGGSIGRHCVSSCGSSQDCPASFTCYDFNGAKMCLSAQHFNGATFAAANGQSCANGGQCHSNFCPNQTSCTDTCSENSDCGGGACAWQEFAADQYIAVCDGPAGAGANGASCSADNQCRGGVCYGSGTCGDPCGSTADCPGTDVCGLVNYSVCTVQVITCFAWQPNFVKACVASSHGNGAVGTACTQGSQCRSGLCFTTTNQCTDTCSRDADCPGNFVCGVETYGTLSDGTDVFINVCKGRGAN